MLEKSVVVTSATAALTIARGGAGIATIDRTKKPAAIASVRTFAFSGIEAVPVEVQVQISSGLPAFLVVGLPDKAVAEARERVRAAL